MRDDRALEPAGALAHHAEILGRGDGRLSITAGLGRVATRDRGSDVFARRTWRVPDHRSRARVVWIGVRASQGFLDLQASLEAHLRSFGIEHEPQPDRPFRPHLTLARFSQPHGRRGLGSAGRPSALRRVQAHRGGAVRISDRRFDGENTRRACDVI